jgi:HlyD family secretion protein
VDKPREIGTGRPHARFITVAASVVVAALLSYAVFSGSSGGQNQNVAKSSVTISKATVGKFDESVAARGTITPKTTIYLDAIVGGIVEEKLVERGSFVKKSQPLLRLSNTNLQLEVISREAQIAEQINMLRNNQLLAENSRLQLRSDILQNKNEIARLEAQLVQTRPLVENHLLPKKDLQDVERETNYYIEKNAIALERQKQEEAIRGKQKSQLETSAAMLQQNLDESRKVLDNLLVRAPFDGYLSELDAEIGESKSPGSRLGRIDVPGSFKVVASIDEYYRNRIGVNLPAVILWDGTRKTVAVSRVDRKVTEGKFTVEVDLPGTFTNTTFGQTVDMEFVLARGTAPSIMIARGAFLNDTGGNWVFVVSADGKTATRRPIRLGSSNREYFQVERGVAPGESVITSSYGAFDKADTLHLE